MNERLRQLRDAVMRREGRKVEVDENGRVREVPSSPGLQDATEPRGTRLSKRTFGNRPGTTDGSAGSSVRQASAAVASE
jgi:hypothetical protein